MSKHNFLFWNGGSTSAASIAKYLNFPIEGAPPLRGPFKRLLVNAIALPFITRKKDSIF